MVFSNTFKNCPLQNEQNITGVSDFLKVLRKNWVKSFFADKSFGILLFLDFLENVNCNVVVSKKYQ